MSRPRIGRISYINCLPIFYALEEGLVKIPAQIVYGHPSELNRALTEGHIEISAVSSFAYAEQCDKFLVLPDLSISSWGPVKSVALLSKVPLPELAGKRVSLTPYSATSVALLSILVERFYNLQVKFFTRPPGTSPWWSDPEATLVIGDEALLQVNRQQGLYIYDLGREWQRFTGQHMVFALVVVQEEFARSSPGLLKEIWQGLMAAKEWGRQHLALLASQASSLTGLPLPDLIDYFHHLQYDLTPKHLEGLHTFYQYTYQQGLLPAPVNVKLWRAEDEKDNG
ncbi:menaquinone biosynthetic enzyme MqnA/MqnD family protein [Thermanaeromonas sp. C210]|uniref:menaquinone biosynthetic enzyme MqnA/MqnD family protein n=1 Tax=Thermanaeromonas sp. C210 TaxID=2731925 RepID=UPI00155B4ECE|nr:menaquinone biosynthesis protein [Thermanaeromonas sp. C210]GFN23515.1 chorismate dehydratase [Thermanaeromonas sp. C210]